MYLLFKGKKWCHGTVTTREGYFGDRMQRIPLPKGQTEAGFAVPHWTNPAAGKNNWENRLEPLPLPQAREAHSREGSHFCFKWHKGWWVSSGEECSMSYSDSPHLHIVVAHRQFVTTQVGVLYLHGWTLKLCWSSSVNPAVTLRHPLRCAGSCVVDTFPYKALNPYILEKSIQSVRTCMEKYKYFIKTSGHIILRVLIPHFGLLKTCY